MGVWVLAGSWCGNNLTDGFVPREILSRWGTPKDAQALVAAGLWEQAEQDGEKGWRFHNWTDFQPSKADEEAKSRLKSEAGRKGGLNSASNRKRVSAQARASADGQAGASSRIQARPDPTRPDLKTSSSPTADAAPDEAIRDDVERLCDRLAARVEANTGKRPTITKTWRDSARLLIDRDGRTEPRWRASSTGPSRRVLAREHPVDAETAGEVRPARVEVECPSSVAGRAERAPGAGQRVRRTDLHWPRTGRQTMTGDPYYSATRHCGNRPKPTLSEPTANRSR
jgi:hypothetical protein